MLWHVIELGFLSGLGFGIGLGLGMPVGWAFASWVQDFR